MALGHIIQNKGYIKEDNAHNKNIGQWHGGGYHPQQWGVLEILRSPIWIPHYHNKKNPQKATTITRQDMLHENDYWERNSTTTTWSYENVKISNKQ